MNCINIAPSNLSGKIKVPPSKSFAHRAVFCAILSRDICKINNIDLNDDILATIRCATKLGAKCHYENNVLHIDARNLFCDNEASFNCGESGSTLRFLIPIVASGGISASFFGQGKLPQRPIKPYLDILPKFGIKCKSRGGLPLKISGKLEPGEFKIQGDISSQFITGLLLALPTLDGDSKIILTTELESKYYVDMTVKTMDDFGVCIQKTDYGYYVPGRQAYNCMEYTVEDDWSQSAFWIAAGLLSRKIKNKLIVTGLNIESYQGDKKILDIFKNMNGQIEIQGNDIIVYPSVLKGCDIDLTDTPDLLPAVSVVAMFSKGKTYITGLKRLKLKESDRLTAMANGINDLWGNVHAYDDSMSIYGIRSVHGGKVNGFNDHRIVMALSVASVRSDSNIVIKSYKSVKKSYPSFFEEFIRLGGNINVI